MRNLTDIYDLRVGYWEAVECLRKVTLVGVAVMLGPGSLMQIGVALLVTLGFACFYIEMRPYDQWSASMLAQFCQVINCSPCPTSATRRYPHLGPSLPFRQVIFFLTLLSALMSKANERAASGTLQADQMGWLLILLTLAALGLSAARIFHVQSRERNRRPLKQMLGRLSTRYTELASRRRLALPPANGDAVAASQNVRLAARGSKASAARWLRNADTNLREMLEGVHRAVRSFECGGVLSETLGVVGHGNPAALRSIIVHRLWLRSQQELQTYVKVQLPGRSTLDLLPVFRAVGLGPSDHVRGAGGTSELRLALNHGAVRFLEQVKHRTLPCRQCFTVSPFRTGPHLSSTHLDATDLPTTHPFSARLDAHARCAHAARIGAPTPARRHPAATAWPALVIGCTGAGWAGMR